MEPPLGGLSFLVKDLIAHSVGDPSTRVVGVWLTTVGSCLQRGEQSSVIIGHGANQGRHRRAGGENFGGASTPFISGVGRSKITASGSGLWAASRASRPFDAAAIDHLQAAWRRPVRRETVARPREVVDDENPDRTRGLIPGPSAPSRPDGQRWGNCPMHRNRPPR